EVSQQEAILSGQRLALPELLEGADRLSLPLATEPGGQYPGAGPRVGDCGAVAGLGAGTLGPDHPQRLLGPGLVAAGAEKGREQAACRGPLVRPGAAQLDDLAEKGLGLGRAAGLQLDPRQDRHGLRVPRVPRQGGPDELLGPREPAGPLVAPGQVE